MIKNAKLAEKIRSKHKDLGMDAFAYVVDGKYGLLQTAKPKTSMRSNCFYLSMPGKPEIKIDNVLSYTLVLHKSAATLSMSNRTNWIYFSRFHDQILEQSDFENSYLLIIVQKNKFEFQSIQAMVNHQKREPFVPRYDVLLYKNLELIYTFRDVLRLDIDRYNFSEERIFVRRENSKTGQEEYYRYNGNGETPFCLETLYNRFSQLSTLKAEGREWADIPDDIGVIPFYYLFPNGKAGDIHQYLANEYGESAQETVGVVRKTCFNSQNPAPMRLLDSYATKDDELAVKLTTLNQPLTDFIFSYHIPHALHATAEEIELFTGYQSLPDNMKDVIPLDKYKADAKAEIELIYEKVVLSGESSRKWVNEARMFIVIKSKFPDAVFQYRDSWLGRLSLDIYIPSIKTGVEYQGEQHYRQIDFFGENSFKAYQRRDKEKRRLCEENGIKLIEWRYDKPITENSVDALFKNLM